MNEDHNREMERDGERWREIEREPITVIRDIRAVCVMSNMYDSYASGCGYLLLESHEEGSLSV